MANNELTVEEIDSAYREALTVDLVECNAMPRYLQKVFDMARLAATRIPELEAENERLTRALHTVMPAINVKTLLHNIDTERE